MTSAYHIIHRVNLDLEAPDEPTARLMQDEAVGIFYNWILPKLEQLLDRLIPKNVVFRLDSLDLDLDRLDAATFEEDFGAALLRGFEEKIEQLVAASPHQQAKEEITPVATLTEDERHLAILLFFLTTGSLPWWSERTADVLQEEVLTGLPVFAQPAALERLFTLLGSNTAALERLLLQFSFDFVICLITALLKGRNQTGPEDSPAINEYLKKVAAIRSSRGFADPKPQQELLTGIIRRLAAATAASARSGSEWHPLQELEAISRELADAQAHSSHTFSSLEQSQSTTKQPASGSDGKKPEPLPEKTRNEQDGIYTEHAGLVLLHPFLEYYFKEFKLLHLEGFQNTGARNIAVHLLQYLATGRENPPEYLLTFEKFLCDADLLTPVPRYLHLTEAMKEESEKLLQAAISHWKALKHTSPEGLREGFLQRSGKLMLSNFQNRLIVEKKSHDVLLNYLPWGYGIIRLPWLKQPLIVDWVV